MTATVAKLDLATLRRLTGGDPTRLPVIVAVADWSIEPRVTFAAAPQPGLPPPPPRIFMTVADAMWLKERVPLEVIEHYAGRATVFRIALERHHLAGGVRDGRALTAPEERKAALRRDFGFDPPAGEGAR